MKSITTYMIIFTMIGCAGNATLPAIQTISNRLEPVTEAIVDLCPDELQSASCKEAYRAMRAYQATIIGLIYAFGGIPCSKPGCDE